MPSTTRAARPCHPEHATVLGNARGHECTATREHVHVAGELAGCVLAHEMLGAAGVFDDVDRTLEHHVEAEVPVTLGEENVARSNDARMSARGDRRELGCGERGKRDVLIGCHGEFLQDCGVGTGRSSSMAPLPAVTRKF